MQARRMPNRRHGLSIQDGMLYYYTVACSQRCDTDDACFKKL